MGRDLEESAIIHHLRTGDDQYFREIYDLYKKELVEWLLAHQLDYDEALDIYQEAMANLYLNAKLGNISTISSSLKTYIYAIAKNKLLSRIKQREHIELMGFPEGSDIATQELIEPKTETKNNFDFVFELLDNLGEPCKSIITRFYLHNLSHREIAKQLGYKNENVLKSKKWRCLEYLRNKLK